jgi:hypothetical protein
MPISCKRHGPNEVTINGQEIESEIRKSVASKPGNQENARMNKRVFFVTSIFVTFWAMQKVNVSQIIRYDNL